MLRNDELITFSVHRTDEDVDEAEGLFHRPGGDSYLGHKNQGAGRSVTFTPERWACLCVLRVIKMDF